VPVPRRSGGRARINQSGKVHSDPGFAARVSLGKPQTLTRVSLPC
jgi:hypothetical protein